MEQTEKLSLIKPRPSPKMDQIYWALEEGWPGARINGHDYDRFVLWGLIGNNTQYMQSKYIFCDMPYNGRFDPENPDWDNTFWRWCYNSIHDNRRLDVPLDRFEKWGREIKPWKTDGDYILICPSSETMTRFMHGQTQSQWIDDVRKKLAMYTSIDTRVRFKPRKNGTSGPSVADIPIEKDLEGAKAVVTSGSITAVDALLEGVPVFGTSLLCPTAWCTHYDFSEINKPRMFDREHLLANLAYKQFSIKEMRDGTCHEISMRFLNR